MNIHHGNKKKIFTIIISCAVALFMGCVYFSAPIERNDIYAKCSKGDTISFEIFKKADRIMKTDKWYFVFLDLYGGVNEMYAPHLVVLDHNLVLKGASGRCPIFLDITETKGDTLFGLASNENKANQRYKCCPYRDDLPSEVTFVLRECNVTKFNSDHNAIIDSMALSEDGETARLYLKVSDKVSFPSKGEYLEHIDYYSEKFDEKMELEVPVSSLCFCRDRLFTFNYSFEDNIGSLNRYEMYVLDDNIIERFLCDYWKLIRLGVRK